MSQFVNYMPSLDKIVQIPVGELSAGVVPISMTGSDGQRHTVYVDAKLALKHGPKVPKWRTGAPEILEVCCRWATITADQMQESPAEVLVGVCCGGEPWKDVAKLLVVGETFRKIAPKKSRKKKVWELRRDMFSAVWACSCMEDYQAARASGFTGSMTVEMFDRIWKSFKKLRDLEARFAEKFKECFEPIPAG